MSNTKSKALLELRKLADDTCLHYRDELRAARADVLADAEGFERICFAVEKLGRRLHSAGHGLGSYHDALLEVVCSVLEENDAQTFSAQFVLMKDSRNDYMHVGSHARNAGSAAVEVASILERALVCVVARRRWVGGLAQLTASDLMVSSPVLAHSWNTLGEVRNLMLHNSFTFIPVRDDESRWYLISDTWLASKLASHGRKKRNELLQEPMSSYLEEFEPVEPVAPDTLVPNLTEPIMKGLVLVRELRSAGGIAGVIAPSDLL